MNNKNELELVSNLYDKISGIIENRKYRAQSKANQESVLMFWEVGKYINFVLLDNERATYGKKIVVTLSQQLQNQYGSAFERTNVTRMMKLASRISDIETMAKIAEHLSWSHIIALLPLKTDESLLYYVNEVAKYHLSVRDLRREIERKAYERREIANSQLSSASAVPFNAFKDPYLLDVLGLKDTYLEKDLEQAILSDLETFILEAGHGFTFVARQKRMTMDGEDYSLDLLFFHRELKRLVAIDLKIGKFKPKHKGQMKFYLRWLNRYERKEWEEQPIGILLCTEASREQVELMEMDQVGIAVAQYWTSMPTKEEFEHKIAEIYEEAQERLARRETRLVDEQKLIETEI